MFDACNEIFYMFAGWYTSLKEACIRWRSNNQSHGLQIWGKTVLEHTGLPPIPAYLQVNMLE